MNNQIFKIILPGLAGFAILLLVSLFIGTNEFNYYCRQVQLGNPNGINFRGLDSPWPEGFLGCKLFTPTFNFGTLVLGGIALSLFWQVYLSFIQKKSFTRGVQVAIGLLFACILGINISIVSNSLPQIARNPLEGRVSYSIPHYFFTLEYITLLIGLFSFSQLGPLLIQLKTTATKPTSKVLFIFEAVISQIMLFILGIVMFYFYTRMKAAHRPQPILRTSPRNKNTNEDIPLGKLHSSFPIATDGAITEAVNKALEGTGTNLLSVQTSFDGDVPVITLDFTKSVVEDDFTKVSNAISQITQGDGIDPRYSEIRFVTLVNGVPLEN